MPIDPRKAAPTTLRSPATTARVRTPLGSLSQSSSTRSGAVFAALPRIFLLHLRRAEEGIAARIKSLAEAEPVYPPIDFEKAVAWCEQRTGKTLAPSQREALKTHPEGRPPTSAERRTTAKMTI